MLDLDYRIWWLRAYYRVVKNDASHTDAATWFIFGWVIVMATFIGFMLGSILGRLVGG